MTCFWIFEFIWSHFESLSLLLIAIIIAWCDEKEKCVDWSTNLTSTNTIKTSEFTVGFWVLFAIQDGFLRRRVFRWFILLFFWNFAVFVAYINFCKAIFKFSEVMNIIGKFIASWQIKWIFLAFVFSWPCHSAWINKLIQNELIFILFFLLNYYFQSSFVHGTDKIIYFDKGPQDDIYGQNFISIVWIYATQKRFHSRLCLYKTWESIITNKKI